MRNSIRIAVMVVMMSVFAVVNVNAQERGSSPASEAKELITSSEPNAAIVFKALSQLDIRERKTLLGALTPDMKAAMWRLNIQIFLNRHAELAADQHEVLTEIASLLTSDLYDERLNLLKATELYPVRERLAKLNDRAMILLAPDELTDVLLTLGQITPDVQSTGKQPHIKPDYLPGCNCNASAIGIEDCTGGPCLRGVGCVKTQDGCGPEGIYPCNGTCA